jgi:hypothetical protein
MGAVVGGWLFGLFGISLGGELIGSLITALVGHRHIRVFPVRPFFMPSVLRDFGAFWQHSPPIFRKGGASRVVKTTDFGQYRRFSRDFP